MLSRLPYRWELLFWLWLAFFFNQADRQVFAVVLPQLKADLGLTDIQAGLIASIFTATLAVTVPLAGYAGDVWNRKWLVTGSLFGWSLSTLLTGFATTLGQLIGIRSLATGAGEAIYAPAAYAMMGEHHVETRATAMAIHQTALYCGVVASGFLAGWLADHYGWRAAFLVFGGGGVLLAGMLAMRLRSGQAAVRAERPPLRTLLRTFAGTPTIPLLACGFGAMVFVNIGYLTWMPTYLHERFGMTLAAAGFASMFYHHLAAFAGVLLGGRVSDLMAASAPQRRLHIQAGGLLLGAPFLWAAGTAGSEWAVLGALGGFGFFRGAFDSNSYASLFEVVEPRLHASMSGLMISCAFLSGAAAPLALGAIKQAAGLGPGISWLSMAYVLGGTVILIAAKFFFQNDHRKVHHD